MIEMQVMGIALDTRTGSPIVILNDMQNRKALPIWIGSAEASAIIRKIENIPVKRPMTHDLICDMLEKTGQFLKKIEINEVEEDTYFATLCLEDNDGKETFIDARPSDAIAIAMRVKAPIFATTNVILDGTIPTDKVQDEKDQEEFKSFIEDIKPSDFKKLLDDKDLEQ